MISIELAINKYLNIHRATSSSRTVRYYQETLDMFKCYAAELGIYELDEFNQDNFLMYLQTLRNRGVKNTTVNTYTRGLRAFAHWCVDNNYINKSFCDGIKRLRDDSAQVYPLTQKQVEEINELMGIVPFDAWDYMNNMELRNFILFHLMLDCGLRRQEVISLNIEDIQDNCLVINNSKFNKSRIVPLPSWLHTYIRTYILKYRCANKNGPVLLSRDGNRITSDCIRKVFYNIKKKLGIKVYPHLLRHTFATSYIAGGGNMEFLRVILGHASYNITQRYLHIAAQCMISDIDIYKLDKCFFKNYNN